MKFVEHLKQFGIAIDQLCNTLIAGMADETLSARCFRNAKKGYWYAVLLKFILDLCLSPIKRNHCFESYYSEIKRKQLPPCYRSDV